MSTSPSRRLAPDTEPALRPFPYDDAASQRSSAEHDADEISSVSSRELGARDAEIRSAARLEGESAARLRFEGDLAQERSRIAAALAEFARDRAEYWRAVEAEVVQLSLSIARKILHREAQVEPLVLAGLVRVALEKIDGATSVVLRVHPQRANEWRTFMQSRPDAAQVPEIREDPSQPPDRCSLETSMGRAELGLDVQLKEIELGLMDLLAARQQVQQ